MTLLNEKIANRYKCLLINKCHNKKFDETIESKELKKIITLPYINNFQEQFHRIFKNSNLQIIFTCDNTIQEKILKSVKTPTPNKFKYNVVYEVKCIQCNSLYIGQTCRFLDTRMFWLQRSNNFRTWTKFKKKTALKWFISKKIITELILEQISKM